MKEAQARIKINKLLEAAGWRFFAEKGKPANISLEPSVTLQPADLDAMGDDFTQASRGFVDFVLQNDKGQPCIVLEAKAEHRNPLDGKEQARKYARSLNCRFVILSNGNLHYLWDLDRGNPYIITAFPSPDSIYANAKRIPRPDPQRLASEPVKADYIALTQRPTYEAEAGWRNIEERPVYIKTNRLRFLREYQMQAIHALQRAVKQGDDRFLFEMATGTGKTLISAGVIKLFLRTGNAGRILFLVDRLELEDQAKKAFTELLSPDYKTVIFKENRDDWQHAEIVVSTVQSLLFNNRYQHLFSPTDFDLVISDEAHRSIGGNARSVFEYFTGYKLGLTATPRDYLRRFDQACPTTNDPREHERRLLLDTYRTFGCQDSQPTFRYSLIDGVRDGFLINPTVIKAQTHVTTKLLSEKGFVVDLVDELGQTREQQFKQRQFEKKFFSNNTNKLFCKTFLEHALRDPISQEVGKSIVFCVSQRHASKITQILNQMADRMFPGRYQSDFAVQVTSHIPDAQQFTINFVNNNLLGSANFLETYRTSKARVCVTVGMMTTGYDCPDILNLGLFRPIFSPTDFIQIKGRGTRKHTFTEQLLDDDLKATIENPEKTTYKMFDFFANCDYFEHQYDYDQVIDLPTVNPTPTPPGPGPAPPPPGPIPGSYEHTGQDLLDTIEEQHIGLEGMKIDRMFFQKFEDVVREDTFIVSAVEEGRWDDVIDHINKEVFNKPDEYYTLDKLRRAASVDRRITLREILQKVFHLIPRFKSKDELLEEEFSKFVADRKPDPAHADAIPAIKHYFKAYAVSNQFRDIIDTREYTQLYTNPTFSMKDFKAVPDAYRTLVPEYIKDYVVLNQFTV